MEKLIPKSIWVIITFYSYCNHNKKFIFTIKLLQTSKTKEKKCYSWQHEGLNLNNLYNTAFVRINISVRKKMEVKNEKYLKWIKILLLFCNHKKVNCGRFTCVLTLLWKINFFLSLIITPDFFFLLSISVWRPFTWIVWTMLLLIAFQFLKYHPKILHFVILMTYGKIYRILWNELDASIVVSFTIPFQQHFFHNN